MDYAELERRTLAHMNVVGDEHRGRTSYTGRLPRGLHDDMMESIALGRAAMRGIDFGFVYGLGDPVDWPDNLIECTEYREVPPEQLLLPPGSQNE